MARQLGIIWRPMMRAAAAPIALAATIYSISFTDKTWDRTVRTTGASMPMTMAIMTLFKDEPRARQIALVNGRQVWGGMRPSNTSRQTLGHYRGLRISARGRPIVSEHGNC